MSTEIPSRFADTSSWSYHIGNDYYRELSRQSELLREDWPESTTDELSRATSFLAGEARLVDEGRFNDWLELFTDDCLYWVPVTPGGGEPTVEVSHAFDDRRRLTDRVYWLRTGLAFCQIPASRTRRVIGNVETTVDPSTGDRLVRSNFVVHEFRAGVTKIYPGWYGHVLRSSSDGWRIRLKQVNLLDSDQLHENLTLVF
ncbi:aromatic-ring-hydroxylating dioxygenase [Prauserella sp. PE36]|uniref:Aromatic-ring-hydroxylating dioxygenase n=1 Tax=Prauserella endophytica TaxID=1592324 RepID=A0ABY2S9E8_9PSEU|nr:MULTISPECIES: aromatic-ring-hydroxylating dioxygenase subunit beta [Prauserella]PXY23042.1 aromatic-ring-hydroxylating dioxygenase [Prauserella coralliicola]RBM17198.1 aromatic-ring-hydroxylating dioxygenase [Prauserella sp. PE36]TKG72564.1 aromatic-ring-hydroxylating dioxygenase [Prauserella endophytica]